MAKYFFKTLHTWTHFDKIHSSLPSPFSLSFPNLHVSIVFLMWSPCSGATVGGAAPQLNGILTRMVQPSGQTFSHMTLFHAQWDTGQVWIPSSQSPQQNLCTALPVTNLPYVRASHRTWLGQKGLWSQAQSENTTAHLPLLPRITPVWMNRRVQQSTTTSRWPFLGNAGAVPPGIPLTLAPCRSNSVTAGGQRQELMLAVPSPSLSCLKQLPCQQETREPKWQGSPCWAGAAPHSPVSGAAVPLSCAG